MYAITNLKLTLKVGGIVSHRGVAPTGLEVLGTKGVTSRELSTSDNELCLDMTFVTTTENLDTDSGYEVKTGWTLEEDTHHSTSCGTLEEDVRVTSACGPVELTLKVSFSEHVAETNCSTDSEPEGVTGQGGSYGRNKSKLVVGDHSVAFVRER